MNYQSTNKIKCDFILFFIFNGLSATENGNTSMCCGNSELIRVSFMSYPRKRVSGKSLTSKPLKDAGCLRYSGPPALRRYFAHSWASPFGPAFGCSNSILSNLSGCTSCIKNHSRRFCRRRDEFKIRTTVQFRGNDAEVRQLYNSQAEHKLPNILFIVIIFDFYNNLALPGPLRSYVV